MSQLDDLITRQVARFVDRKPDWDAFADARVDGFRRAQHRFIGAGGSGKHDRTDFIPAQHFTLSIMFVPPGQGNAAHTHEVEEVFFILQGKVKVFLRGRRRRARGDGARTVGLRVVSGERDPWVRERRARAAYLQVMLGASKPQLMGYVDEDLARRRDEHLTTKPAPAR
jgi:mannose-6-phosphate isomerase-like protein (cupin superfamily)